MDLPKTLVFAFSANATNILMSNVLHVFLEGDLTPQTWCLVPLIQVHQCQLQRPRRMALWRRHNRVET